MLQANIPFLYLLFIFYFLSLNYDMYCPMYSLPFLLIIKDYYFILYNLNSFFSHSFNRLFVFLFIFKVDVNFLRIAKIKLWSFWYIWMNLNEYCLLNFLIDPDEIKVLEDIFLANIKDIDKMQKSVWNAYKCVNFWYNLTLKRSIFF